jgi:hypothetical protein
MRHKRFGALTERQEAIAEKESILEDNRMEIENVCEDVCETIRKDLGISKQKAYKEVKKLLKQVAKYGF